MAADDSKAETEEKKSETEKPKIFSGGGAYRNNQNRRNINFNDDSNKRRPTLDVFSFHLIHLWNVSNSLNWGQLRKTLSEKFGKVKFIETFEAWTYKKIGHIVLEFETATALNSFVNAIKNENFLEAGVQWEVNKNRRQFFKNILDETGVDFMSCKGVPPTFKWKDRQRSNIPPPVNPSNGWVTTQNHSYQDDGYQQPYGRNFGESQLPNQPYSTPKPYTMPTVGSLMAATPFQQQMQSPWPSTSTNQQTVYNSYGSLLGSTPGQDSGPYNQRRRY